MRIELEMANIDFAHLQVIVETAAKTAYRELTARANDLCAFALYSDPDAITIRPSANTSTYLKKVQEEDPDDVLYYKYSPAEWRFGSVGAEDQFAKISDFLRGVLPSRESDRIAFKEAVYEVCLRALEKIRTEESKEILLMFSVPDSDVPVEVELARASRLNKDEVVNELKSWTDTWND
jgi:hypothetical protein